MGMWRVALSEQAELDLERVTAFLAVKSVKAAERIGLEIVGVIFSLDELPARGAPVLCGPLALVQQGQAAVKLKRAMGGRFTSRRGAYGQPPTAQIAELRRYYGAIYPGVKE